MAVYSNGGFSSPDIWLVISLVLSASVSCLLNPIVFRHNLKKKRSLPRDLYLALSATDFLTGTVLTSFYSYGILQPREESCQHQANFNRSICENAYYRYLRPATTWEKVMSTIVWWLYFTPCWLTAVISMSRWFTIKYPLRNLSRNKVETITGSVSFIMMTHFATTIIYDPNPMYKTKKNMITQLAWNASPFGIKEIGWVIDIFGLITTIPATVASILTIHQVWKSSRVPGSNVRSGKRLKSAIKVALLAAGSMLAMSLATGRLFMKREGSERTFIYYFYHNFLMIFLPILTSNYDSMVYVLCSRESIFRRPHVG